MLLDGEKQFEERHSTFEQSWDMWTSWRLFNINQLSFKFLSIVIICDVPNLKNSLQFGELQKCRIKFQNIYCQKCSEIYKNFMLQR